MGKIAEYETIQFRIGASKRLRAAGSNVTHITEEDPIEEIHESQHFSGLRCKSPSNLAQ
jgi:hypothetical protein